MNIDIYELDFFKNNFDNLQIDTPDGYQKVGELYKKRNKNCFRVLFSNGDIIECSEDHLYQSQDGEWVKTKDICIGDIFLSINGSVEVLDIENIGVHDTYDLEVLHPEHRYYSNDIISHNSGKTLLSLATAIGLVKKKEYNKIIYIRNSIESLDKGEDVGYLPGMEEKFAIYNHPLMDCLQFIVQEDMRKSKANKSKASQSRAQETEEAQLIQERTDKYMKDYGIETMWTGEMRGRTLSNAFVIVDESQNTSSKTLQLVLSRCDSTCKVIVIGSNKQIDNMYTNKYINGLSTLLKACTEDHDEVRLWAGELNKVMRGPITEFAEKIFSR